jgi:hypothetical protein
MLVGAKRGLLRLLQRLHEQLGRLEEAAQLEKTNAVKWDMFEESCRTKRARKHAAFVHRKEVSG